MTGKNLYGAWLLTLCGFFVSAGQVFADNSYGAIAYSGSSYVSATAQSWNSLEEAKRIALYNCNQQTPAQDCFVPVEFQNACGALAIDYHGNWGGWWQTPSQAGGHGMNIALGQAKQRALHACQQYAGAYAGHCRIIAEKCAVAFNL